MSQITDYSPGFRGESSTLFRVTLNVHTHPRPSSASTDDCMEIEQAFFTRGETKMSGKVKYPQEKVLAE